MLDRESQTSAEELAHQQERFDIHVMAFADRSPRAVALLQQAFGLDSVGAERLLSAAPLVVKRGAPPDVAHALLDVLVPLGAQVVLLPAPPSAPPPPSPEATPPPPAAPLSAAAWGNLDIDDPHALHDPAAPHPGMHADAQVALASTVPPPPASAPPDDDDLEFDLGADDQPASDEPPPAIAGDVPSEAPAQAELGLGEVPPLPAVPLFARTTAGALPATPPPIAPARPRAPRARPPLPSSPLPPPLRLSNPPPPLPPPTALPPVSPPLQRKPPAARAAAPAGIALPAPRVTAPAATAAVRPPLAVQTGAARGQRLLEPAPAAALAPLELAHGRERRDAPRPRRIPELEPPKLVAAGASLTHPALPDLLAAPAERKSAAQPAAKTAARDEKRSRGLAAFELAAGAAVLYFGLHLDDTVLHGNASLVSLALHGLAFYALGAGLARLRP